MTLLALHTLMVSYMSPGLNDHQRYVWYITPPYAAAGGK